MQTGQEKLGMQTMNQSLATLYLRKQITLEAALASSSNRDELQDLINRGVGVVAGGRTGAAAARRDPVADALSGTVRGNGGAGRRHAVEAGR